MLDMWYPVSPLARNRIMWDTVPDLRRSAESKILHATFLDLVQPYGRVTMPDP